MLYLQIRQSISGQYFSLSSFIQGTKLFYNRMVKLLAYTFEFISEPNVTPHTERCLKQAGVLKQACTGSDLTCRGFTAQQSTL